MSQKLPYAYLQIWRDLRIGLALTGLAITGLLLTACAVAPVAPAATTPTTVVSSRCGDPAKLGTTVSVLVWEAFVDPQALAQFEEECGVKIIYDTAAANEEVLAKLQTGVVGYDLIMASNFIVPTMIGLGLLRPIDHANIPNMTHLNELYINPPYDPGNRYTVAYQWGMTGIGYDADRVAAPPTSLAALFDPAQAQQYAGQIALLNDMREVMGAALKYLGYSMNSTDPAQLEEAKQVILAIKPYIATFDNQAYTDLLVSGETVITQGWNGGIYQAIFTNPERNIRFAIPAEGTPGYTENFVIPASAPNPYAAEVLINYFHDPEIAAMNSNFTYYPSANDAALAFISDEIKNDPGIYPPAAIVSKMEFLVDLGEAAPLWERIWTEIKAQ